MFVHPSVHPSVSHKTVLYHKASIASRGIACCLVFSCRSSWYRDFFHFSAILDWLYASLDHPRRVDCGPNPCSTVSSSTLWKFEYFVRLSWKCLSMPLKLGVWRIWPSNAKDTTVHEKVKIYLLPLAYFVWSLQQLVRIGGIRMLEIDVQIVKIGPPVRPVTD